MFDSDVVEASNKKFMGMTAQESDYVAKLTEDLIDQLVKAVEENAEPDSAIGKEIAAKHKEGAAQFLRDAVVAYLK